MERIPDYRLEPPDPPKYPSCPFCDSDLYDYVIEDIFGNIVGCSECTRALTAEEYCEFLADED